MNTTVAIVTHHYESVFLEHGISALTTLLMRCSSVESAILPQPMAQIMRRLVHLVSCLFVNNGLGSDTL
jgi:hypothetical protein